MRLNTLWTRLANRLNTMRVRSCGVATPGPVTIVGKRPHITNAAGSIVLGVAVQFRGTFKGVRLKASPQARISIGDRTFLNEGVVIAAVEAINIGRDCLIGDDVKIFDTNFHEVEQGSRVLVAPIRVGNNVWIGREALLMPGVEIGDHSVIGARSVVTKSIPARTLAAGIPAKPIRSITAADDYVRR